MAFKIQIQKYEMHFTVLSREFSHSLVLIDGRHVIIIRSVQKGKLAKQ